MGMNLDAALTLLAREPSAPLDVAELALRLARDEYPDLDVEAYLGELDAMAHEARRFVRGDFDARVHGLCRYLFHEMGFHGNTHDYYDPRNSYLNDVLDRRTGLPITLSVVAIAIGTRVGLNVVGVGLPGHFLARAIDEATAILFDPFHGGRRLDADDCAQMIRRLTQQPFEVRPEHLRGVPPGLLTARLLTNLKGVYQRTEDFPRAVRVLERLCQLAPGDAEQRRDLGRALLAAEQPGRAIDHLTAYVRMMPEAGDVADVKEWLDQARAAVARWN